MSFWQQLKHKWHYALGMERSLYKHLPPAKRLIMYHNVVEHENKSIHLRHFSQDDFRRQMMYLQSRFRIVSLHEWWTIPEHESALAITFDDGLINNLRYAVPILKELEIPATIFVSTSYIRGESVLWPDRLSWLLHQRRHGFLHENHEFMRENALVFRSKSNGQTIQQFLMERPLPDIQHFLQWLSKQTSSSHTDPVLEEEWTRVMKGEEIRIACSGNLIEIGSHTVSHSNLLHLTDEEVEQELRDSKDYLEKVIGQHVQSLAYPFGLYNERIKDIAESCGYTRQLGVWSNDFDKHDKRIRSRIGLYADQPFHALMHEIWHHRSE